MILHRMFLRFVLVLALVVKLSHCLTISDLYPFGPQDEKLLKESEVSSPEIKLTVPIVYYQEEVRSAYVSCLGFKSFFSRTYAFVLRSTMTDQYRSTAM